MGWLLLSMAAVGIRDALAAVGIRESKGSVGAGMDGGCRVWAGSRLFCVCEGVMVVCFLKTLHLICQNHSNIY